LTNILQTNQYFEQSMSLRISNRILIIVALLLSIWDLLHCDESVSVGKLRNQADTAFSTGDFENSLNLWAKVCATSRHMLFIMYYNLYFLMIF
jgi:hypothetical protein